MPMVKGKKFAYTKRGKAAAKRARMKLKKKRSKAKPMKRSKNKAIARNKAVANQEMGKLNQCKWKCYKY